jgi:peptide-methionine (R)-S-oxide reductase
MNRRYLLTALLAAPALSVLSKRTTAAGPGTSMRVERLRNEWRSLLAAGTDVPSSAETLDLSEAQWRERLDRMQYQVLREEGTERPFTSPLNDEKRDGVFLCAGCDLPVFTSAMKYDSGTGWPSFFTSIPDALKTKKDFKLVWPRTEYHCARCGGHHGHIFDDGPAPTRERWCNNGVALKFLPSA